MWVKYALAVRVGRPMERKTEEGEDGLDTRLRVFREEDRERVCIDTCCFCLLCTRFAFALCVLC